MVILVVLPFFLDSLKPVCAFIPGSFLFLVVPCNLLYSFLTPIPTISHFCCESFGIHNYHLHRFIRVCDSFLLYFSTASSSLVPFFTLLSVRLRLTNCSYAAFLFIPSLTLLLSHSSPVTNCTTYSVDFKVCATLSCPCTPLAFSFFSLVHRLSFSLFMVLRARTLSIIHNDHFFFETMKDSCVIGKIS